MMSNDDMNLCVLALRRCFPLYTCWPYFCCFAVRFVQDMYLTLVFYTSLDFPKSQQPCKSILNGVERISPRTLQNENPAHCYTDSTSTAGLR